MTSPTAVQIDLTDPDQFVEQRHYEMFSWLRENDPVHWHATGDGPGFWALTTYEDVAAGYLNHTDFSSEAGPMLGGSLYSDGDPSAGQMLVSTDPPRHRMLRQQLHQTFSQHVIKQVAHQVGELVDAAIGRALADGGCDFSTDIAEELPAGALMVMMGISRSRAHELIGLTRSMIGYRDPLLVTDAEDDERLRLAVIQADIFEFCAELLREKRANPGDDLISRLLGAELNGRPWTENEILFNCMNIAVGGDETSSYTACAGVVALDEHPDQLGRLRSSPQLLDGALNEILRWNSTNLYVHRVALRDTVVRGKDIRRGESVTKWNVSANRDPAQFRNPESFDITRSPNKHMSYGIGIHRCIGAMLAHTELTVLFRKLLDPDLRIAVAGPPRRLRSNFIQGITRLPVALTR
ncbi:cytochrome P450 [Streptomyces sp. NBC_01264]|uniref:cytochrome P450 n=1 Tax=Streptomyces sp. NBC_01264 TaxID=2903804 RepID=UPI0022511856|nr:cytochrome P450 [Streptomyces sp. NBC_01264]MCX4778458.1 cytochrome P450 [Streptomyces sp. NBC_01264]